MTVLFTLVCSASSNSISLSRKYDRKSQAIVKLNVHHRSIKREKEIKNLIVRKRNKSTRDKGGERDTEKTIYFDIYASNYSS